LSENFAEVRFARSGDVETSTAGDRVVLYHRRSRHALILNPTGSWIWTLLVEPTSVAGLAAALRRRHPTVPLDQAERDVTALLDDLRTHGAVESQP
jgi:coenzyme PQQ synthesis protein D (PqqD)